MDNDIINDSEQIPDVTEYIEKPYQTTEVASMLGIAVPTVRKYAKALENAGYKFERVGDNRKYAARSFMQSDIMAMRYFLEYRKKSDMQVDRVASVVVERFGKGADSGRSSNDTDTPEAYTKGFSPATGEYEELKAMIREQSELIGRQNDLIGGLVERLDRQEEYLNRISGKEIEADPRSEEPAEEKKGFFSRLFGK